MWGNIVTDGRQVVSGTGLAEPISVSIVAAGEAVILSIIIYLGWKLLYVRHGSGHSGSLQGAAEAGGNRVDPATHASPLDASSDQWRLGSTILRDREFSRLAKTVYADYGGCPPFPRCILTESAETLLATRAINPHSVGRWMPGVPNWEEDLRQRTLASCNVSGREYVCVLKSGATAALKLAGELVPWPQAGDQPNKFAWLIDNHNSVLGIREIVLKNGGALATALITRDENGEQMMTLEDVPVAEEAGACRCTTEAPHPRALGLFAFPMESNFDGRRYDLSLVKTAKDHLQADGRCWMVLLDAAKGAATGPPDLSRAPADLVVLSYYKMFGYPTGLGALLIRRETLPLLTGKSYFGGGAVTLSVAHRPLHRLRPAPAGLEDGTPSFLSFPAALAGFQFVDRVGGWGALRRHAMSIAQRLVDRLVVARHASGMPLCTLYGAWSTQSGSGHMNQDQCGSHNDKPDQWLEDKTDNILRSQGPAVCFSVHRADGSYVGYREVEQLASLHDIVLRTGCMCNPGACGQALGLTDKEMEANHQAGHVCWDGLDTMNGKPTGAIRVSFGFASQPQDADRIFEFLERYFLEDQPCARERHAFYISGSRDLEVETITLYPIKACRGMTVSSWPLGSRGLLYDRQFCIVDANERVLTPKICPELARIQPFIDWKSRTMTLHCTDPILKDSSAVSLDQCEGSGLLQAWLSEALRRDVRLITARGGGKKSGGYRNEKKPTNDSRYENAGEKSPELWSGGGLDVIQREQIAMETSPAMTVQEKTSNKNSAPATAPKNGSPPAIQKYAENPANGQMAPPPSRFANTGDLLLVSRSSLDMLRHRSGHKSERLEEFAARFRPNLIVSGPGTDVPFAEDGWKGIGTGQEMLATMEGSCPRCDRICFAQGSGRRQGPEPLLSLASMRRVAGRVCFGVLLNLMKNGELASRRQDEESSSSSGRDEERTKFVYRGMRLQAFV